MTPSVSAEKVFIDLTTIPSPEKKCKRYVWKRMKGVNLKSCLRKTGLVEHITSDNNLSFNVGINIVLNCIDLHACIMTYLPAGSSYVVTV